MAENNSFLGRGWKFPPEFNRDAELVEMSSKEVDINESLEIILSTKIGERIMNPDFGCNLDELVFAPINLTLVTYVKGLIKKAILLYETRIDLIRVDIVTNNDIEGELLIEIDYQVRATNSRRNLVYPFYRGEGTDV